MTCNLNILQKLRKKYNLGENQIIWTELEIFLVKFLPWFLFVGEITIRETRDSDRLNNLEQANIYTTCKLIVQTSITHPQPHTPGSVPLHSSVMLLSSPVFLFFLIPHPLFYIKFSKSFFFPFKAQHVSLHLCSISRILLIKMNSRLLLCSFPWNMVYASIWDTFFMLHSLAICNFFLSACLLGCWSVAMMFYSSL